MDYKIVQDNATKKLVQVLGSTTVTPTGYTAIGTFTHPADEDLLGSEYSHVIYHHVQEALYHQNIYDVQSVTITWPGKVIATALANNAPTISLGSGAQVQLVPTFTPASVSDKRIRYVSENDKVARVTQLGKVFAQSAGTTIIRMQSYDGRLTARVAVTVAPIGEDSDSEGE